MYSLVTAVLFATKKPTGFNEVGVGDLSISNLYKTYSDGYLVLSNTDLPGELFLPLKVMKETNLNLTSFDTTVKQWLSINGSRILPTIKTEPEYEFGVMRYADAYQAGFKKQAVHPTSTISGYPLSSLHDLYLTKDMVDSTLLAESVVFSINGYLHLHSEFKEGVKVTDATKSILHSKMNQVGVLSFVNVGGVDLKSFKDIKILKTHSDISYYQECYLDLGIDLKDKSLMFSIAGHLIYSRDAIRIVDENLGKVVLNLSRINFIDRIQLAAHYLEFSELMLADRDYRVNPISIEYLLSDAFILSVLRMSQSFAIVVDRPYMAVRKAPTLYGSIYGRYYDTKYAYRPMIDEFGRFTPYFYQGVSKHPFMNEKHAFITPIEYVERKVNIRDTAPWRYRPITVAESTPYLSRAMRNQWLTLEFIKPA